MGSYEHQDAAAAPAALLVESLRHLGGGRLVEARAAARRAAESGDPLSVAVTDALEGSHALNVYDDPRAFQSFVDGATNVALYAAVARRLRRLVDRRWEGAFVELGADRRGQLGVDEFLHPVL